MKSSTRAVTWKIGPPTHSLLGYGNAPGTQLFWLSRMSKYTKIGIAIVMNTCAKCNRKN